MNIIYMLENLDKKEGRRFYIGSKTECFIEEVDGVNRIVSSKTGKLYYGSSTCIEMKSDMEKGNTFNATILEEVPEKKGIIEVENKWIKHFNAVDSYEFYNKGYALMGIHQVDQNAQYNPYGETILGYGKLQSSFNKKNNTAIKYGFENLGKFCIWIHQKRSEGLSYPAIAEIIGWERHQPARYVSPYDMDKCIAEYDDTNDNMKKEVRLMLAKGASVAKTAELLNLEIPSVIMYVGDYNDVNKKLFLVAQRQGLTKDELELKVTKLVLDGMGFNEVSRKLGINQTSVKRYFFRCVRANLKSEDLK